MDSTNFMTVASMHLCTPCFSVTYYVCIYALYTVINAYDYDTTMSPVLFLTGSKLSKFRLLTEMLVLKWSHIISFIQRYLS